MPERSMEEIHAIAAPIEKQLLSMLEVLAIIGISRTTFYRIKAKVGFPEPIMLGGVIKRWHRKTVDDWIAEQVEKSTT
ncbi:MAG: AlpA family phage regulatory protein [Pelagimonas sp.]|nr:AlpA family phage regulatory protein [Pelagimonas sp.]